MLLGLGAAAVQLHAQYETSRARPEILAGITILGQDVGGQPPEVARGMVAAAAVRAVQRPVTLVAQEAETTATAAALGATPRLDGAIAQASAAGRSGDLVLDLRTRFAAWRGEIDLEIGYALDEARALEQLQRIAPIVERPSLPTRLDLEARKVLPASAGAALLAYDSMSAVAIGVARGSDRIELVVEAKPPVEDPLAEVAATLDLSAVVGTFETPYQTDPTQNDRNHNLKVGAAALDGTVVMPGETFSFNATVGERSAEAGYRYGTGITAGELVDVLGGGICQISSTIFGAGFFAGLEIVEGRPHSRPSSYVDMGLDSTVVWPDLDLKMRNPYDFPIVVHMTVSQGKVRAQILGARRPYRVAFERTLREVLPFRTVWRDDANLRAGSEDILQHGRRGFTLARERKFYEGDEVVRTESWDLHYPPTTEIVRRGTSPNGATAQPSPPPPLRDPAPHLRIMQ